jgi:hypothetical protein
MQDENKEKVIEALLEKVSQLSKRVEAIETLKNDIPTSEELAAELKGEPMTLSKFPKRKRGVGASPILESEILEAQSTAVSAADVAKKLGVSYLTYRKYAKLYGLFEKVKNPAGKGVTKQYNADKGKYPLKDILQGMYPDYPVFRLKNKLIKSGIKKGECEQCHYSEKRITDGKTPLLVIFEDGNNRNHKLENLTILCYNCSFTSGKIWMKCKKREKWLNNPDRILGSPRDTKQYF